MSLADLLTKLPAALDASAADGVDCVVQFDTSAPHYATIKDGTCAVTAGTAGSADVTLTIADDDLVQLLKGELNGIAAFMSGQLKLDGDMMLAQRVMGMFDAAKLG